MAAQGITGRAVLLDALGTLIRLEPPAPRLAQALAVDLRDAERAVAAEMAYYRANLHRGRDASGLAALRMDCARVVQRELPGEWALEVVHSALLDAIRFTPFDDAVPALRELRSSGVRTVVVSNWDLSLHDALAGAGLTELVDGAVASAEVGVAKPDVGIFSRALALAGAGAADAWHVGDTVEADVEGALAAGIRPVLIVRSGPPPRDPGAPVIHSLAELTALLPERSGR
jgi:putative hydrolase of the HAD superfamily